MRVNKKYNLGIFIFRRDLRLIDNHGLIFAAANCATIVPCFIVDPRQVSVANPYRSDASLQFMTESLRDLDQALHRDHGKLYVFQGNPERVIKQLIKSITPNAIICNRDYTPFSIQRDLGLEALCKEYNIDFYSCDDLLLTRPEDIITGKRKSFSVFMPFLKKASSKLVQKPQSTLQHVWYTKALANQEHLKAMSKKLVPFPNKKIHTHGGRTQGLKLLHMASNQVHYHQERDVPSVPTTSLSAHLKFGTISIRETYHALRAALGSHSELLRQLYWRDYYTHIAFHSPSVFGHAGQRKYEKLPWSNDNKHFKAWCEGRTGVPIVDAGMRQLNTTGFMHNRIRMITASFLTKDLHVDWRWGERYFAQKLIDYDPAVNNGNWQWIASTGICAMPYFRIFNPWLQQKKYDPQGLYIKQWVPELRNVPTATIHNLFKSSLSVPGYPPPLINHSQAAAITKTWYKKATKSAA